MGNQSFFQQLLDTIRQHFSFSRKETYGTLFLLLLMACALLLPYALNLYDRHHSTLEVREVQYENLNTK